ncbi:MAG: 3-methyl-2-oxobutanoate hydroxymethyltransferase [Eggerthellaceae bacterium]|nr:3-methyl-2-oxobutanoate hydroxymethyltransferase [Eggerthellaceae bacterium]
MNQHKRTVLSLTQQKARGEKIAQVTAYDYTTARLVEAAGLEMILVGDSLGMTMMGHSDTLPVTIDDMVHYTRCVTRAIHNTFVVADMPFMTYQQGIKDTLQNAGRLIKEGRAHAVKLEGGKSVASQIQALVEAGIPVQGHIGLTPQAVHAMGGFKVQGKDIEAAKRIIEDAFHVQEAGAFSVVIEGVPSALAQIISEKLDIITIGIGAGNSTDGQVLVVHDLLGLTQDHSPKFAKQFAHLGEEAINAFRAYNSEVKCQTFPKEGEHTFSINSDVIEQLKKEL